jgi:hypothetical protein
MGNSKPLNRPLTDAQRGGAAHFFIVCGNSAAALESCRVNPAAFWPHMWDANLGIGRRVLLLLVAHASGWDRPDWEKNKEWLACWDDLAPDWKKAILEQSPTMATYCEKILKEAQQR